jgi:hypothetical protein
MLFANNGILSLFLNRNEPKTGGSTQCWNSRTICKGAMGARNREGIGYIGWRNRFLSTSTSLIYWPLGSRAFTQIRPVWVGDSGTRPKNSEILILNFDGLCLKIGVFLFFLALSPTLLKKFWCCRRRC